MLDIIDLGDGVFGTDLANPSCIVIFQNSKNKADTIRVSNIKLPKASEKETLIVSKKLPVKHIKSETYFKIKDYSFITDGFELSSLVERLQEKFSTLIDFIEGEIQRGISADYADAYIVKVKDVQSGVIEKTLCKPLVTGHNASRYYLEPPFEVIIYLTRDDDIEKFPKAKDHLLQYRDKITCKEVLEGKHPWYALHRPRNPIIFSSPKLVGLTTSDRLMIDIDTEDCFAMDNLYLIHLKDNSLKSNLFMLSILNSSLLSSIYELFAQESNRVLPQVKAENLYSLPIPLISFTTPKKERKEFFEEAVELYRASRLDEVLKWTVYELALKRNDTVHDFLAYLAEQMIEMNKKKNEEIKGFLKWLEREIGAEIEGLTNKTAIKEYHDNDFNHLLDVLKKNKNKISTDPSARKTQEHLETNFANSMKVLSPLKAWIRETDVLIDHIVYKLYALSPEEIAIVVGKR